MNAVWHRWLTAGLASLMGVSSLLAATNPAELGVSGTVWAWVTLILAIATGLVTAARAATDPNPTT